MTNNININKGCLYIENNLIFFLLLYISHILLLLYIVSLITLVNFIFLFDMALREFSICKEKKDSSKEVDEKIKTFLFYHSQTKKKGCYTN